MTNQRQREFNKVIMARSEADLTAPPGWTVRRRALGKYLFRKAAADGYTLKIFGNPFDFGWCGRICDPDGKPIHESWSPRLSTEFLVLDGYTENPASVLVEPLYYCEFCRGGYLPTEGARGLCSDCLMVCWSCTEPAQLSEYPPAMERKLPPATLCMACFLNPGRDLYMACDLCGAPAFVCIPAPHPEMVNVLRPLLRCAACADPNEYMPQVWTDEIIPGITDADIPF